MVVRFEHIQLRTPAKDSQLGHNPAEYLGAYTAVITIHIDLLLEATCTRLMLLFFATLILTSLPTTASNPELFGSQYLHCNCVY